MTIQSWLRDAAYTLTEVDIPTALLDAEIILAHTLRKDRTWLHAHNEESIGLRQQEIADARLELRKEHVPVAYIVGYKEFYGRKFKVTPSVLIPRPESEQLIDDVRAYIPHDAMTLLDVGTGSGCLGITAKLEFPNLHVTLSDSERHALTVAEENARLLDADVRFVRSDLFTQLPGVFDIIIANLPYVDANWERSKETNYEPEQALFASDGGLAIIYRFLDNVEHHLSKTGLVIIEADPEQHDAIVAYAERRGLRVHAIHGYSITLCNN